MFFQSDKFLYRCYIVLYLKFKGNVILNDIISLPSLQNQNGNYKNSFQLYPNAIMKLL
jgi:hypothetical protein